MLDASFKQACPVQEKCGGCPLLPLDRSSELEKKLDSVAAALTAFGIHQEVALMPEPERFGYRNRLRMKVVDGRVEFFNKAKHNGCPVVRPDLWVGIERVLEMSARDPNLLDGVAHIEVRVGDDGGLGLVTSDPVDRASLESNLAGWAVSHRGMRGGPALKYRPADDVEIDVPVTSFVQVNSAVNQQLVGAVLEVAAERESKTFLDLFCGSGNFAIPLAARGLSGTGVENVGAAINQLAQSTAAKSGAIQCIEGDAHSLLRNLARADLVIADPPRAGLQHSHGDLVNLVSDTLVLIGCKATSFAKDVAALSAAGLVLESVSVFDMFPGTKHVEALRSLKPDLIPVAPRLAKLDSCA